MLLRGRLHVHRTAFRVFLSRLFFIFLLIVGLLFLFYCLLFGLWQDGPVVDCLTNGGIFKLGVVLLLDVKGRLVEDDEVLRMHLRHGDLPQLLAVPPLPVLHLAPRAPEVLRLVHDQLAAPRIDLPFGEPQVRPLLHFLACEDARVVELPIRDRVGRDNLDQLCRWHHLTPRALVGEHGLDVVRQVLLCQDGLYGFAVEEHWRAMMVYTIYMQSLPRSNRLR